jgi:hypothetical protein
LGPGFVEGVLVVELKAVKALEDIFFAITRSYTKAVEVNDGMILNFASMPLTLKRVGVNRCSIRNTNWENLEIRNSWTQCLSSLMAFRFPEFVSSKFSRQIH